jgi:hypothetical protein
MPSNGLGCAFDARDLYLRVRPARVQQHAERAVRWRQLMQ